MGEAIRNQHGQGQHGSQAVRRYKLQGSLVAGGSAKAVWIVWDTDEEEYINAQANDQDDTFTLYSAFTATGNTGDEGYCAYFPDRGQWEVIESGGTQIAVATLSASLSQGGSASATYSIGGSGSVTVWDCLLCTSDNPLASGTKVVIAQIAGKWYVIQAQCPC